MRSEEVVEVEAVAWSLIAVGVLYTVLYAAYRLGVVDGRRERWRR